MSLKNIGAVIPRIGASVTFYGAAVVRQFEMMDIPVVVESQALVRSRDKLRSLQILSSSGVGMPKTVFTNYSKEVTQLIESVGRSEEHTSELQSRGHLVCRLLLE